MLHIYVTLVYGCVTSFLKSVKCVYARSFRHTFFGTAFVINNTESLKNEISYA